MRTAAITSALCFIALCCLCLSCQAPAPTICRCEAPALQTWGSTDTVEIRMGDVSVTARGQGVPVVVESKTGAKWYLIPYDKGAAKK